MKTRSTRGRFHNPQPALFIGLKDHPCQGLLFDGTDEDPEPAEHWTTIFEEPAVEWPHVALCRGVAEGWLVIETGTNLEMNRAQTRAEKTDHAADYKMILTYAAIGEIIDQEGDEVYP
jgi:hypothetical protein